MASRNRIALEPADELAALFSGHPAGTNGKDAATSSPAAPAPAPVAVAEPEAPAPAEPPAPRRTKEKPAPRQDGELEALRLDERVTVDVHGIGVRLLPEEQGKTVATTVVIGTEMRAAYRVLEAETGRSYQQLAAMALELLVQRYAKARG